MHIVVGFFLTTVGLHVVKKLIFCNSFIMHVVVRFSLAATDLLARCEKLIFGNTHVMHVVV